MDRRTLLLTLFAASTGAVAVADDTNSQPDVWLNRFRDVSPTNRPVWIVIPDINPNISEEKKTAFLSLFGEPPKFDPRSKIVALRVPLSISEEMAVNWIMNQEFQLRAKPKLPETET